MSRLPIDQLVATRTYRRDSLDRFGDDLCQQVLSYVDFVDRFRWESASKQWQRVIYRSQHTLTHQLLVRHKLIRRLYDTNNGGNDTPPSLTTTGAANTGPEATAAALRAYEVLLRKCQHIRHLEFSGTDAMLTMIVNHCPHLQAFHFTVGPDVTVKTVERFFATFGRQLSAVICETKGRYLVQKSIVRNVKSCPELQEFRLMSSQENQTLRHIFSHKQELLLEKLHTIYLTYGHQNAVPDDQKRLELLCSTYGHRFRVLHLTVHQCVETSLGTLAACLSQLSEIIDLQIDYKSTATDPNGILLATLLRQMGAECRHVRRLELTVQMLATGSMAEIIKAINYHYPRLRRLILRGTFPHVYMFTGAALKRIGKRLTHLTLHTCRTINPTVTDALLATIDKTMPRLRELQVSNACVSDAALRSLARLDGLQVIEIDYTRHQLADQTAIDALRTSHKIRRILIRRQTVLTSRHALIPNFYPQFYLNYPFVQMP